MSFEKCVEAYKKEYCRTIKMVDGTIKKQEMQDYAKSDMNELRLAYETERLNFDCNYIVEPWNRKARLHYPTVIKKVREILVTGVFDGSPYKKKYYPSIEAERKTRSKRAYENIMAGYAHFHISPRSGRRVPLAITTPVSDEDVFKRFYRWYGESITEYEHAFEIIKRLRSYRKSKQQELEDADKAIRDLEDKFPRLAEDPSAFEIAAEAAATEKENGTEDEKK